MALPSGTRGAAITSFSGSCDGSTGIWTSPPPSARRRLLLPLVLELDRLLPVAGPDAVPVVPPPAEGRRAAVTRPVVRL